MAINYQEKKLNKKKLLVNSFQLILQPVLLLEQHLKTDQKDCTFIFLYNDSALFLLRLGTAT